VGSADPRNTLRCGDSLPSANKIRYERLGRGGRTAKFSVIVPVHNAARMLDACLASLERSTVRDFECIVVDDGSTDDSEAVALRHGATVVSLPNRGGPARARNRGAAQARGGVLVFFDADVCVHTDTLAQIAAHLDEHPHTAAVIGSYDNSPADPGIISQYKNLLHHYVHHHSSPQAWTFWAGCGAVRREAFFDVEGFDESYARPCIEDIELGLRLRRRGHRIDLNPAIQATHLKRWTFWTLLRTDLLDRAVPWFVLMLRSRTMPPDLNLRRSHRLSVVLVFLLLLLLATPAHWFRLAPWTWGVGVVALAAALMGLNWDLYRFFARQRGVGFAAAAVPLHWLYYGYCGVAVGIGACVHLRDVITGRLRAASVPSP